MKKSIKILSTFLILVTTLSFISITAFALSWDGSTAGGGGNGTSAGPNGYAIRYTDNDTNLLGYRFSAVDKNGGNKVSKVIDVFRDTYYGKYEYDNAYKFVTKNNKKQLINNQNGNYSTSKNSTNCYKESNMGFATPLPVTSEMETWQNNTTNLNRILSVLGVGSISNLKNGDKILVEPIYDVRLESVYHAVTVSEIAIYGKHILGASSDGGISSNPASWGFISEYVNKHYPNTLYTTNGQGLWTGVGAAAKRLTFYEMINLGYGVGIAYTETKSDFSPVLSVKGCRAYKGTLSTKTYLYGTSTGNAFSYWTVNKDYPQSGDTIFFSVNFPKESENCYVKQTVWIDGVQIDTRNGYSNDLEWFDFAANSNAVTSSKIYYTVKARVDWIETNGTVKRSGAEKTFYIPVKPIVTRERVTAYNIEGNAQAYSGSEGSGGKLYFGQKVNFQYHYGAKTTWESSNTVSAIANQWNSSSWSHIFTANEDGKDVLQSSVLLSKTKSYTKNSSIGTYTIPLPANEDPNSFRLKFDMTTEWDADGPHTTCVDTYYIPVVKCDVELEDIKLADRNGNYVDRSALVVGDLLTIRYFYKNNTDCAVFVKGYNDSGAQISGVFAVPAGETIEVEGESYTVPDKRSFNIWGGVYLDTVERGNTMYETNGLNNAWLIVCKTSLPLSLSAITPNAPYREGTDVISSFRLWNYSQTDYTPDKNLKVRLRVYKSGEKTPFVTVTKTVIVPAVSSNLVYFKWRVPTGLNSNDVTLKADICRDSQYWNEISDDRETVPYIYNTTSDTRYEEKVPSGFIVPAVPSGTGESAVWYEYYYENGGFIKKEFGIALAKTTSNKITPVKGGTAVQKDGQWIMKSGYGFSAYSRSLMTSVPGYSTAPSGTYTVPQYCYLLYPEYNYSFISGKATTLERYNETSTPYAYYQLPTVGEYGRVHFTPLWFPDGTYAVKIVQSDCWTPAGMITKTIIPNTITISGNAYDDWYEGRR